jgi:diguanylate cyclase (GGDEF)-like protein
MRSGRRLWLALTTLLIALGTLGAVIGARTVAQDDAQKSLQSFTTSAKTIASTLKLTLQHEQDLSVAFGAFLLGNPDATEAELHDWVGSVDAFERYPELQGVAELVFVPESQLSAFAIAAVGDAAGPLASDGTFQVFPAGIRPYYCLEALSDSRADQVIPAGIDFCKTTVGPGLLEVRDSGQGSYAPFKFGKLSELGLGVPIYRSGKVPTTVQARRDEFIGWTGILTRPAVLLATALRGHPHTAVTFRYDDGFAKATFSAGSAAPGAQATTVDLHNGWRVEVLRRISGGGILANQDALLLLAGGLVVSLLLGALIYLLGTSRSRAVRLVHEQIGQLRHQALHDSLTGLPNRALILDRIGQMLSRTRRSKAPVAALFLDLDDFKDINDTLGHTAGDQLLVAVATRLTRALREGDTVGRLGGDEFVVLTEGSSLIDGAEVVAARILESLETPFEIASSKVPLSVTASIGIASGDRVSPEELLRDADIALYRAKAAGKRRAVVFSPSMQVVVDDHRNLAVDLHHALESGQFFLLYQPTVDLATGAFTGVEALLRWRHPERGVIQPDDFIPALESSNLIVPVGRWVLEEACRQGANWHKQGYRISVSVNVSVRQLERDRIIDDVHGALAASGFAPSMLILELTETTLMNDLDETITRLGLLKALGVRLAVDDFGTGYSSLAYLRQFPVDVLKIDRSFVSGIADTREAAALAHTLVQLGRALGLETIAEGVETDDQQTWLRNEKVDGGQGFLFARPLDVAAVDRLLDRTAVETKGAIATRDELDARHRS